MPRVDIQAIDSDPDGGFALHVSAANQSISASMEIYTYPDELSSFASQLEGFPLGKMQDASWEWGPRAAGHMLLRAHQLDVLGHSAIEVLMDIPGASPVGAKSNFYLRCNPGDVNELGRRIRAWLENPWEQLTYEWRDA